MKKNLKNQKLAFTLVLSLSLATSVAQAVSLDWSGQYRIEYTNIDNTSLGSPNGAKNYFLHAFELAPEVVVSDGLNVKARLNFTPNQQYPGAPVGDWFGNNVKTSKGGYESNTSGSNKQKTNSNIQAQELYMSYNMEHAQLLAGRWPIHFGLGTTYNAGLNPFDHWRDSYDGVAWKFVGGNWSITPMFTRVYDASVALGQQVSDQIFLLEYNNTETESQFGVFHRTRASGPGENDSSDEYTPNATKTIPNSTNTQHVNVFIARGWPSFKMKVEAGFESGTTGLKSGNNDVSLSGNSIVSEMDFLTTGKKNYSLKLGLVTGDNPTTPAYEGYNLDRNYDLGFLMMNHPMGRFNIFSSYVQRQTDSTGARRANEETLDEDAVGNVVFLRPEISYQWSDKLNWKNSILWAQLDKDPRGANSGTSKDVGFEFNSTFDYKVTDRFTWQTRLGVMLPGAAWKGASTDNFDNKTTYGWETKAAISF